MSYTKHTWTNDELPALNGTNLNNMENGIEEAHKNFSNYKLNGDFAIISGEIECTNTQGHTSKNINYPIGFTKENCVVISIGTGGQAFAFGTAGLAYGYSYTSPQMGLLAGSQDRNVIFYEDHMSISIYNPSNNAFTYSYKIVLMKISEEEA